MSGWNWCLGGDYRGGDYKKNMCVVSHYISKFQLYQKGDFLLSFHSIMNY